MTSRMTGSVLLFLGWMIVAKCRAGDLKVTFTDYLALSNGHFNDVGGEVHGRDSIDLYFKPTFAPGLQKDPVMYFEEIVNGEIFRRWVVVRKESSTDNILYASYYNITDSITDSSQYEPWTFNTDDLVNYKREQFQHCEDCFGSIEKMTEGALIGTVNDPRHWFNKQHPQYVLAITCNYFRFTSPIPADEDTTILPYNLKFKGPRYPVLGAPEGYVSPCKDTQ